MRKQVLNILNEVRAGIEDVENNCHLDDVLDSLDIVQMICSIEDTFDVEVDPEDIVPESFASVDAICHLVEKSRG